MGVSKHEPVTNFLRQPQPFPRIAVVQRKSKELLAFTKGRQSAVLAVQAHGVDTAQPRLTGGFGSTCGVRVARRATAAYNV